MGGPCAVRGPPTGLRVACDVAAETARRDGGGHRPCGRCSAGRSDAMPLPKRLACARRPGAGIVAEVAISTPQAGAAAELRGFIRRYIAAWNGFDADPIAQLITEDVTWADPALPELARGVAAVQEFMRTSARAFPDLRFSEPDPPVLAVAGDLVLWGWRMEGTHR